MEHAGGDFVAAWANCRTDRVGLVCQVGLGLPKSRAAIDEGARRPAERRTSAGTVTRRLGGFDMRPDRRPRQVRAAVVFCKLWWRTGVAPPTRLEMQLSADAFRLKEEARGLAAAGHRASLVKALRERWWRLLYW